MNIAKIEQQIAPYISQIDEIALANTKRVLAAFQKHRVSDIHFAGTTGYGYNDSGRDTLDAVFADIFGAEDALVRVQFVNGTHAIACALRAVCEGYLSLVGKPYDTLQNVMPYTFIEPQPDGTPDFCEIERVVRHQKPKAVMIQRSRGYSQRQAISIEKLQQIINIVKSASPETKTVVDNCYCEFCSDKEPSMVGADIVAGSLIKNPGGGLAPTGGYIAGKTELVNRAAEALTVPGIGRECGSSLGQNRLLYQGIFTAPHVVAGAMKTAVFAAALLEDLGFCTSPNFGDTRYDIIQTVNLKTRENLLKFVDGIQKASPVDSFLKPEPWAMPGYVDEVVMAAGTFVQGASIELSCDAPLREPYTAYIQGAITYEAGKLGIISAVESITPQ